MTTGTTYNATVAGFNTNGMVILSTSDGSIAVAQQTGNGVLQPGQPVVLQRSSVPGVSDVCFDPTATPTEPRVWDTPDEPEKGYNWSASLGRRVWQSDTKDIEVNWPSLFNMYGTDDTKPARQPTWLPSYKPYSWLKLRDLSLYNQTCFNYAVPFNLDKQHKLSRVDGLPEFYSCRTISSGDGTEPFEFARYTFDNYPDFLQKAYFDPTTDTVEANLLKISGTTGITSAAFVLRAERNMILNSITVSSNIQPGGPQFDPSLRKWTYYSRVPGGDYEWYIDDGFIGTSHFEQFIDFGVIRKGKETAEGVNVDRDTYIKLYGSYAYYDFLGTPGYPERSFENHRTFFVGGSNDQQVTTVAQFSAGAPPASNQYEDLRLTRVLKPEHRKLAKGDLLVAIVSYPYFSHVPGKYAWKLTKLSTI